MESDGIARRAGQFVRSILPADRSHLLLLFGATFLFISQSLCWWSQPHTYDSRLMDWASYTPLLLLPMLAAGSVAYYLAFVGCKRPARRLFDSVLLPAFADLIAVVFFGFWEFRGAIDPKDFAQVSVIDDNSWNAHDLFRLTANLGTGIRFAIVGMVLLTIFMVLLLGRHTSLPIRLKAGSTVPIEDDLAGEEHRRTMLFVWMMIGLVFLANFPVYLLRTAASLALPLSVLPSAFSYWRATQVVDDLAFFAFVLLAVRSSGRKMIPSMFRIPAAKYIALAALIPAAIANALPLATYLHARILWSTHGWGKFPPPDLGGFLGLPGLDSLWLFLPALTEEIAWRGYLQPRFIRRYGLFRGIFFVGVVWGAFHFAWNFDSAMNSEGVMLAMFTRITRDVVLSYVLAWLTIRSRSILPTAIAHTTSNAFHYFGFVAPVQSRWWLNDLLWAAAGFILFRFFAPPSDHGGAQPGIPANPQRSTSGV